MPGGYRDDPSKTWPLIVDFHGRNGSPEGQWNNSQYFLNPLGREYFVAYPLGCIGCEKKTAWQGAYYANTSCNDILFTADLVNQTQHHHRIDKSRIYASGKSNGGGFVDTLACSATGDMFAAFAMAAAALYTDTSNATGSCAGTRPRAILEVHGVDDPTIPIGGRQSKFKGHSTPNITEWASWWGERNCNTTVNRTVAVETWGNVTTYSCEKAPDSVQQYYVNDLGHCWPSKVENTDSAEHDVTCPIPNLDFTQVVLDFFALWSKPSKPASPPDSISYLKTKAVTG